MKEVIANLMFLALSQMKQMQDN